MNLSSRSFLFFGLLSIFGNVPTFATQTPAYLETMPLTIQWQFNVTAVGRTRVAQAIDSTGTTFVQDPPAPVPRVATETGAPAIYSGGNGNQAFFIEKLLRNVLEKYATLSQSYLRQSIDELDPIRKEQLLKTAHDYETDIEDLKQHLGDLWELTAVRAPQTSIDSALTTPYWIFLTKIESVKNRVLQAYDTGMRITPRYSAGSFKETLVNGKPSSVTGSLVTYFSLDFECNYTNDPLYLVTFDNRPTAVVEKDYNSAGNFWAADGDGYITYNFRKTYGASEVIAPTKMKIEGTGTWYNRVFNKVDKTEKNYRGTAPLKITVGEVIYQNSTFFPEFQLP